MGRVVCIDYGLARLGIALSDEMQLIVSKSFIIKAEKKSALTAQRVASELEKYNVDKILVGFPLHLSGKQGFLTDETKIFIEHLKAVVDCPVESIDERLSTRQAERVLMEAKLNRKKRSQVIDALSATILLESYL
ncbi:MAG: Holliday junction resolvase RuvX [Chlamydiia bacterium]|nr:Holliday junction resolvase RuvX [Chlamydiia bacterium]